MRNLVRAAIAAALLLANVAPGAAAGPKDRIVFAWPGPITVGTAPLVFGQDLGYADEANIDLDIVTLDGSGTIIPQLLNGSVFSAFLTYDPLVISRAPGKPNFDYKFVYNSVRNSMWEISVLPTSPIHSIKDLAGKTIGVGALTYGNIAMTKAILKQQGVDPAGVQFVPVGTGIPAFQALRTGKIDALNLFDVMDAEMRLQGTNVRLVPFPREFTGVSSHGYPITNATIRDKPDLVGRFGRFAAMATVACAANMRGCLQSLWKHYPSSRPAGSDDEAFKEALPTLQVRLANMLSWNPDEAKRFGAFTARDITTEIRSLHEGGLIPDGNVDPNSIYTNQFVDQFNAFNHDAVVRRAKAYKP